LTFLALACAATGPKDVRGTATLSGSRGDSLPAPPPPTGPGPLTPPTMVPFQLAATTITLAIPRKIANVIVDPPALVAVWRQSQDRVPQLTSPTTDERKPSSRINPSTAAVDENLQ
jgi:hypothetical protein